MRGSAVNLSAASVAASWPALLLVGELPDDAAGGKMDDLATGVVVALLLGGLLAAGWVRPLWAVVAAVLLYGTAVPHAYEALHPRECAPGISGMDCLPASYGAFWFATAGVIVVLLGRLARLAAARAFG